MITLYRLYALNNPTDTRYIGQTKSKIERRLIQHKSSTKQAHKGKGKIYRLYRWINKCDYQIGIEAIEYVATYDEADKREIELIRKAREQGIKLVNTTEGGKGGRGLSYTKNGKATKVIQYSLDGEFIKVYNCIRKAGEETSIKPGLISGCMNMDRVKSAGGYIWRKWTNDFPLQIESYEEDVKRGTDIGRKKLERCVHQYTIDGEYIREWKSLRYLERETGMFRHNILLALHNNTMAYNYLWRREKVSKIDPYVKKVAKEKVKKVKPVLYQFTNDGDFIRTWSGPKEAAKAIGICASGISTSFKKKGLRGGYIYSYNNTVDPSEYGRVKRRPESEVYQYTLEGKFIKKWRNATVAAREVGVSNSCILACVRGEMDSSAGYQWKPTKYKKIKPYKRRESKNRKKNPVVQYDKNMNIIKIWDSGVPEIIKNTEYKEQNIRLAIAGKRIVSAYGYIWKYQDTDINNILLEVTIRPKRKPTIKWAKDGNRNEKGQYIKGVIT